MASGAPERPVGEWQIKRTRLAPFDARSVANVRRPPHRSPWLPRLPSRRTGRTTCRDLWRDDLVAFLLGCSLTFEHALIEAGVGVRSVENDTLVPIFIKLNSAGAKTMAFPQASASYGPAHAVDAQLPWGSSDEWLLRDHSLGGLATDLV